MISSRVQMLFELRRYEEAAEALRDALAADPEDAGTHQMLVYCLASTRQLEAAEFHLGEARRLAPDDPSNLLASGVLRLARDDARGAEADLQEYVELCPSDEDGWIMLGKVKLVRRQYDEALRASREALALAPDCVAAMVTVAACHLMWQEWDEVEAVTREVLRLDPTNGEALRFQSAAAAQQGSRDKALALSLDALEVDPLDKYSLTAHRHAILMKSRLYRWRARVAEAARRETAVKFVGGAILLARVVAIYLGFVYARDYEGRLVAYQLPIPLLLLMLTLHWMNSLGAITDVVHLRWARSRNLLNGHESWMAIVSGVFLTAAVVSGIYGVFDPLGRYLCLVCLYHQYLAARFARAVNIGFHTFPFAAYMIFSAVLSWSLVIQERPIGPALSLLFFCNLLLHQRFIRNLPLTPKALVDD